MMLVAVVFSFVVAYIAHRGVNGSTAVNIAINVIQISALVVFAVLALRLPRRTTRREASPTSSTRPPARPTPTSSRPHRSTAGGQTTDTIVRDANGVPKPKLDAAGKPVPFRIAYPDKDDKGNFLSHPNADSVVGTHNFGWVFVQATVAILILVGFESVTAMGGEAKNAKRDVPIAVIVSLLVQGVFCYLFEYFAANYFLNSGYHHAERRRLGGAHRRHDDRGRQRAVRPGQRPHLHAGGGVHRVPGADRHHALLHEHRRARHLRHGQGRGSPRALRPAAFQEPDAAPRHLDAGGHLRRGRLHRGRGWPSATPAPRPMRHQGAAAGLLVELRLHHARQDGGAAQLAAHRDAGFQLRHVPAVLR